MSAAPAPSSTGTSPTSLSYTGHDFSIDYPAGWVVSHLAEGGGNLDTTFDPQGGGGLLIRVDENPNAGPMTPDEAAAPVIAQLEKDPTYRNLGTSTEAFDGFSALRWEFANTVNGVLLHKVDEFFTDSSGHGWGVLIEAPQSLWAQDGVALDSFRQTFQTAQAPSSQAQSGPANAVYTYWSQLRLAHYSRAFSELTATEQQRVGGRATFLNYFTRDPLVSVNVNLALGSISGDQATIDIVSLQTQGIVTGCRNWTGSYRLKYEGGAWLIDYANLSYSHC